MKNIEILRIQDPRWIAKDKIYMYKRILKLQERNNKIIKHTEAASVRQKTYNKVHSLINQVEELRKLLKEIQCGDKKKLNAALKNHKYLQLIHKHHEPNYAYAAILDDCHLQQELLNNVYNWKYTKINEFFNLKLKWKYLMSKNEDHNYSNGADDYEEKTAYLYNRTIANTRVAENVQTVYRLMIDILSQDKCYFNVILDGLEADKTEQHKITEKAMCIDKLALENFNNMQKVYANTSTEILNNIRTRQKALIIARARFQNLRSDIPGLVRVESITTNIQQIDDHLPYIDQDLTDDMESIEKIFNKLKSALQTRSYHQFHARSEEQVRQQTHLLKVLKQSLDKRDLLFNQKNNATLILNKLRDTIQMDHQYHNENKIGQKDILQQMSVEKKREADFIKSRKLRSDLLINIKTVLQNILIMMICINPGMGGRQKTKDKKIGDKKHRRSEMKIDKSFFKNSKLSPLNTNECYFDSNVINLLTQVTTKSTILFGLTDFELSPKDEEKAKNLYQIYIAEQKSKIFFNKQESQFKTSTVEHVSGTPAVTRKDIKNKSKNLVNSFKKMD